MAQARHTRAENETETRPRSRLDGHRAILWILALAFAVFVVVFMTSPKESADPKTGAPPGEVPAAQP
ncbi:hypothetical protein ASE17_08640 [Phenylobacterium sp. Root77]|jgi:hypothetical protein|uniref:hypothetical protein n=1 Tax=unclassified Phenylobacterium TaxID=2640670 RepID=UPI0006F947A3|nr:MULTISPECIES: hypothetical protein [unclassified Phenylobacterium]KQW73012.1 hypothetical protein ASC73_01210 [Phenylobacterium sp. Root1277]KQW92231.1 hypothetical protein ASC79_11920 [Phenylobacterium sp. Root1290]KRC40462.1 hypothetical protein ASE17_08640 [Phenylobacterium sp. Root77]